MLMVEQVEQILEHAETIVIGNKDPEFHSVPDRLHPGQSIVDLVRISNQRTQNGYEGISW